MLKKFIIKVNGFYYGGEHSDTTPTPRPTNGWYCNRGESNVIHFVKDSEQAVVIEGYRNLQSHWERVYNAMRYDDLNADKIEIETI